VRKLSSRSKLFWASGGLEDFSNDPTLVLLLCDYCPFEVDLAFYSNKIEFPHPRVMRTKFD
jgi:hypothetical protein